MGVLEPEQCVVEAIRFQEKHRYTNEQTVTKYLGHAQSKRYGGYFWINSPALLLLMLGLFLSTPAWQKSL
ncbi:hypothetical protein [Pseudomonas fluorescens]|uniref:hypothetical protein n=1 Tax=Pseudomonas fluorescens TaxID=294 RepID=UPI00070C326F|nr:hypothetical protein [Pseudomonas fluorescens]